MTGRVFRGSAVVKEIITAHKGQVWAESREGLAILMEMPAAPEGKQEQEEENGKEDDLGESTDH